MLALVAVAVMAVPGCAPGPEEEENPYAAEFASARNAATTDTGRKILEDDVITAAEYQEVEEASVQCMRDQGLGVTIEDGGGVTIGKEGWTMDTPQAESDAISAQVDAVRAECWAKFDMGVLHLYWELRRNPENVDFNQAIAGCMVRGGHRDEGYDKEAYTEELARYSITLKAAADGTDVEVEGDMSGQELPPEMAACQESPER
ncbi:hypothetical protein EQW78_11950 [Oerskovia turbata]|uniref:Uncharacterized protein n=1 Tax=Oerskovia turbata TaxID=1713 RepID=A0A4Q1KSP4_9CELL|nr:hypothetical protein [Oerskovia turbata]RXR25719.1 hypothetical protein EQW73_09395 [Oerskovia turbata]RXR33193.1 hypothetical protein EQW78_11950 [Oerskovia turbata]TGJ96264.1 hypothetical protein DLJ96_11035 [Actinotalea fermentans ATCC 43279 = JCM 9966 = DSM 3133]